MILYHGSNVKIEVPNLLKSKPYKDFGQGFYLSADKKQAFRMAEQKTLQLLTGEPIVSEFEFDETLLDGPIADDGVTFQLRRYQAGTISIEELVKELKYAKGITFQYFFGTPLALATLKRL